MEQIDTPVFKVNQLTVNYDKTPVLWDVSFSVSQGNVVGIIGPNGAGKSTLIKAVLGLIKPMAGNAEFFGVSLKEAQQRVAYIPQRGSVDWDFPITVKDLVLMGRYGRLGLFKRPREADYEAVYNYLALVGMENQADKQISQLSGGQQQRIFIARALLQEAEIYFMDEPFVGIDLATENTIMTILHDLKRQGKTIFIVHHDLNTVPAYFDWLIMLNMRLVACGPTHEVFQEEFIKQTYGRNSTFLVDALKLSQSKKQGE
ncbi:MAG: transporter ATP-binding protein ytgB [Chlamydiales bacterium]|jgi:manganese/zinc/iron transport system ATP- binding protein|nr:transporter ATP-binding protein ytgB [Chlamydiales bacterium]